MEGKGRKGRRENVGGREDYRTREHEFERVYSQKRVKIMLIHYLT